MTVPASLSDLLMRAYGIEPVRLAPAARGFVAETFVAEDASGRKSFVKWLPAWASASAFRRGLAVAERLPALGVPAAAPARTRTGALYAELDGRPLAVFEFVEGRPGEVRDQRMGPGCFNHDYEPLVALIADIHLATGRLGFDLPIETFEMPWAAGFEAGYRRGLAEPPRSEPQANLAQLLRRCSAQIEADWADLRAMAAACRGARWRPLLTHGDLAGDNVMIGDGGVLRPIDWDEPLFAPAERDAWFFTCNPEAESAFIHAYRRRFPDWRIEPLLRRFYLFFRFFQDLIGYVDIILDDASAERQAWSLAELQKTCFEWLWPPMRSLGAE